MQEIQRLAVELPGLSLKNPIIFRENIVGCRFRATVPVEKKEAAVTVNDGRFHSLAVL